MSVFIKKLDNSEDKLPGGPPCLQHLLASGGISEGGRNNGLKILSNIGKFNTYQKNRDFLTYKTK